MQFLKGLQHAFLGLIERRYWTKILSNLKKIARNGFSTAFGAIGSTKIHPSESCKIEGGQKGFSGYY